MNKYNNNNLKVYEQCTKVVKICNKILGMNKRSFTYRSSSMIVTLYKSLLRPHYFGILCPQLKQDINLLEKVQHWATKIISGLEKLTYEERLDLLALTTLEQRRLRVGMIEVFKILKRFYEVSVLYFCHYIFCWFARAFFKVI